MFHLNTLKVNNTCYKAQYLEAIYCPVEFLAWFGC